MLPTMKVKRTKKRRLGRTTKRYQGYVRAQPGHLLLGGARLVRSIWYKSKRDAQHWVWVAKDTNIKAGRKVEASGVNIKSIDL